VKSKWLVLFLIWLMMLVAYFDRINLPVAATAMMASLHLNKAQWGLVLAAFTLGYAIMQAPGGHFADRLGSRRLLIAAIFVWSVFTGLTGTAITLTMLIAIRLSFGFGEGLENGAQFKLVGEYFEPKERAFANSIFLSALALGPMIGSPAATWLVLHFGWQRMFYSFAVVGVVVGLLLIALLPRDGKQRERELDRNSAADLMTNPGASEFSQYPRPHLNARLANVTVHEPSPSFRIALRQPTSWLCAGGYFMFNVAFWGFLSWVPTYLKEDRHIPLAQSWLIAALPYFAGFIGMVLTGWMGSSLFAQARSRVVAVCLFGAAVGLVFALTAQEIGMCVSGLCVAGFFLYGVFGPFWAIAIDLAPTNARGVFTGTVNCCGQIGAFSSQIIIGLLANSMKSFTGAILFMVGALCVGTCIMFALHQMLVRPQRVIG